MATPDLRVTTGRLRWAWPVATAAVLALAVIALRLRDPHVSGSWGLCPWKFALGVDCPGCGGLRAVNDLTHGDVVAAASSNLLAVLAIPAAVTVWLLWLDRVRTRRPLPSPPGWVWGLGLAVLAVFTLVRNLPAGSWLAS